MRSQTLSAYLAQDRRAALAQGMALPDTAHGAALFADISGFTQLTDALVNELGSQRGAEAVSLQLDLIYGALIAEVERYHGSVIAFSGDSITCWFDDNDEGRTLNAEPKIEAPTLKDEGTIRLVEQPALEVRPPSAHTAGTEDSLFSVQRSAFSVPALRAVACGLAMQAVLRDVAAISTPSGATVTLAIRVAVAAGAVRRFQAGLPEIQLLDVLAGATLEDLAAADRVAQRGEVLVTAPVAAVLGDALALGEWRVEQDGRYAVVTALQQPVAVDPWPMLDGEIAPTPLLRPWLLPAVYSRHQAGQGHFLAELRSVALLFVSFGGIDYDASDAGERLNAYVCWAQRTVDHYGGVLLQLSLGDKGSYFYAAFGAPAAHEDDATRAAMAAAQLRTPPAELGFIRETRIGVSMGRTYCGAYGGPTRCTYGVLGNEVNMAARLMQAADPGTVFASAAAARLAGAAFAWEWLPPLVVKGRREPFNAARLVGAPVRGPVLPQLLVAGLPLVGRQNEIATVEASMQRALAGNGQLVTIVADAGMGKSRLVNECIRRANSRQMQVYVGECQSYGTGDGYLVWEAIWRAFFGLDRDAAPEAQLASLEHGLAEINPKWLPRLPLLGPALNLSIPDTELTRSLDARLRKLSLEDLLVSCLRARAATGPIMLVLEDAHWIDMLSHDLLEAVGLAITDLPVLVVVAYRPPEVSHLQPPRITALPNCTSIMLGELTSAEAAELAALKQVHLDQQEQLPPDVVARIVERTQGNPFYIEELLNYLHDRGLAPRSAQELERLDLPASLSTLILSRIDQLGEQERATLKVASIIGRSFRAAWLWGFYPELGRQPSVTASLERLSRLDLMLPEPPEPAATYLFKHILTHGVAYESLPFETRAWLHEQLGAFIERVYGPMLDQFVDLLAHHYDRSNNQPKRREYLRRAGDMARETYANAATIEYYQRLLPLLPADEQGEVRFRLALVLELVGEWDAAVEEYRYALAVADASGAVGCLRALGRLDRKRGQYAAALGWLTRARSLAESIGDTAGRVHALADMGEVYRLQGDYTAAAHSYDACLDARVVAGPVPELAAARANALKGSGTLAIQQGAYEVAERRYQESLALQRELGDRPGVGALLNNLGMLAMYREQYREAHALFEEGLALFRELGDRWATGVLLNNLALTARYQGDTHGARRFFEEAIELRRNLGDRWGVASSLNGLTNLLLHSGERAGVRAMLEESLALNTQIGDRTAIAYCLEDFAGLAAASGEHERALRLAGAAAALRQTLGSPLPPPEQAALDALLRPARAALAAPAAEFAAGERLAIDEAVALATT
jgi:adenylate cyclase